jgi:hypothetical protein
MTKKKSKAVEDAESVSERTPESTPESTPGNTFTFESGTTVTLERINNLFVGKVSLAAEEKWEAENGELVCPTYEIKVAGGGIEIQDHNEITIATEPWSEDEEAQAAWEKYQSDSTALQGARIEATAKVCLKEGVVDNPPDDWCEMREYYDLEVPDHPLDAKWEWLHDVSTGWVELLECAWAIQYLPSKTEEVAKAAESLFRNSLGTPREGADAGTDSEETE